MTDVPGKSVLIPAKRRSLVLELLSQKGTVSVQDLADAVGVSLSTIRRDLSWLAQAGAVQRSHGGATLKTVPGTTFEPTYQVASRIARKEKSAIGRLAADRLRNHQSVIFDSSSTVYEAAYHVVQKGLALTAVTNDIRIAELLAGSPAIHLIVSGGALRPGSYTLLGAPGHRFLQRLHVDVALIGIHAATDAAFCDTSTEVAHAKCAMAAAAERVVVLADSAKFGTLAFYDALNIRDVSEIITDTHLSPDTRRRLEEQGVMVTLAAVDGGDSAV